MPIVPGSAPGARVIECPCSLPHPVFIGPDHYEILVFSCPHCVSLSFQVSQRLLFQIWRPEILLRRRRTIGRLMGYRTNLTGPLRFYVNLRICPQATPRVDSAC